MWLPRVCSRRPLVFCLSFVFRVISAVTFTARGAVDICSGSSGIDISCALGAAMGAGRFSFYNVAGINLLIHTVYTKLKFTVDIFGNQGFALFAFYHFGILLLNDRNAILAVGDMYTFRSAVDDFSAISAVVNVLLLFADLCERIIANILAFCASKSYGGGANMH